MRPSGNLISAVLALAPVIASAQSADTASQQKSDYADMLIDDGKLPEDLLVADGASSDTRGPLRSLSVEFGGVRMSPSVNVSGVPVSQAGEAQNELGVSISGRYQTDNYGLIGIDASIRRGTNSGYTQYPANPQSVGGSLTLTDHDIPLGEGVFGDASLGQVTTPLISLARNQMRFFLPAIPLEGANFALRNLGEATDRAARQGDSAKAEFNFAIGAPGLLSGLRISDFTSLGGVAITGGGQVHLSETLMAGVQAIGVFDSRDPYLNNGSTTGVTQQRVSGQAALASMAYDAGAVHLQGNAIISHISDTGQGSAETSSLEPGTAGGAWLDATWRSGRRSEAAGVYYLGPDLGWGANAMVSDAYGAYYRFSTSSQRWRWMLNLDAAGSVDGKSPSGFIGSSDVRYQLTSRTGIGLDATGRTANGAQASELLAYVEQVGALGASRAEAGWTHSGGSDLYHIAGSQNWNLPAWIPQGSRLSTQVSFDHLRQADGTAIAGNAYGSNSLGLSVSAGTTQFSRVNFDATLAWNSNANTNLYGPYLGLGNLGAGLASQRTQAFSTTVEANTRLSSRWTLAASFTDTRTSLVYRTSLLPAVTSPLGASAAEILAQQNSTSRLVAGYLTLRYTFSAGSPPGTLGMHHFSGLGSGDLSGTVYLDANNNGQRESTETGVAGIVVVLDGAQSVRTDQTGNYRFDNVAEGRHSISVIADALPLPWAIKPLANEQGRNGFVSDVDIRLRETAILNIPATR